MGTIQFQPGFQAGRRAKTKLACSIEQLLLPLAQLERMDGVVGGDVILHIRIRFNLRKLREYRVRLC
jgi:hypothetical protein